MSNSNPWYVEIYKGHLLARPSGTDKTFILAPREDALLTSRPTIHEAFDFVNLQTFGIYQVAVNMGRPKRKGKPYAGGDEERADDGYFYGPETALLLTYKSGIDLRVGDAVLVPVSNHWTPRRGVVIARSSSYDGELKEIIGLAGGDSYTVNLT